MKQTLLLFFLLCCTINLSLAQKSKKSQRPGGLYGENVELNDKKYGYDTNIHQSKETLEKDQKNIDQSVLGKLPPQVTDDKCGTVEYMEYLRQQNPEFESIDNFESWMKATLEEQINIKEKHPDVQSILGGVITIPYVVHIIHNSSEVNSIGNVVGNNLSVAQIESQIRVINEDFNMQNADRANAPWWDDRAVSIGIEFAPALYNPNTGMPLEEPGIDRIDRRKAGFNPPPYSIDYIETTIKPATYWDRNLTLNIWVLDLQSGLYGYAQFPTSSNLTGLPTSGGVAETDGVTIAPFTFGSTADNDGSFTTGENEFGRTLTHEIGHWIGLRHIWGDGDCNADDYVQDTPPQNGSSDFGTCTSGQNTCNDLNYGYTVDLDDMKENFMDYSSDACMNLFTQNQLDRADVVFEKSPGRGVLANSDLDEFSNPIVFFPESSLNLNKVEAINCQEFTDYELEIRIAYDYSSSSTVIANLIINGGSATQGEDYDIIGNQFVTFSGGKAETKSIVVRIYNDAEQEDIETINFSLSVDSGTSNVKLTSNANYKATTWSIKDDENVQDKPIVSFENYPYPEPIECFKDTSITINIGFDYYSSETSWELVNELGDIITSGEIDSNGEENYTISLDLEEGFYTFNLYDSYGDGGAVYEIKTASGELVAEFSGIYSTQHSSSFCFGGFYYEQPIYIGVDSRIAEKVSCAQAFTDYIMTITIDSCTPGQANVDAIIVVDEGSAVEGVDYDFIEGKTISFNGHGLEKIDIPLRIYGDGLTEGEEDLNFHIELSNPYLANIGSGQVSIVILDSDLPTIMIDNHQFTETEGPYSCDGNQTIEVDFSFADCVVPTEPIEVTVSANNNSTAIANLDYVLNANQFILNPNAAEPIKLSIELINDFIKEGDEQLILELNANNEKANLAFNKIIVEIKDPLGNQEPRIKTGIYEDFESGTLPENWTVAARIADGVNGFTVSDNTDLDGFALHVSNNPNGNKAYLYSSSYPKTNIVAVSPAFKMTESAPLDFHYQVAGEAGTFVYDYGDFGVVPANVDPEDYQAVRSNMLLNSESFLVFEPVKKSLQSKIPGYDLAKDFGNLFKNQYVRLVYYWTSDYSVENNPPLAIDNIKLEGVYSGNGIESVKMTGDEIPSFTVKANEEIYFYDPTDLNIAMSLQSTTDQGCTTGFLSSSGIGVERLVSFESSEQISQKAFEVLTDKPDRDAQLDVSLFFTESEIAGWETKTGQSRDDLYMFKVYDKSLEQCYWGDVTIKLFTDNFPSETSWSLINQETNEVLATLQPSENGSLYVEELSLPEGQYLFTIQDSSNDGICCSFGQGSYSITIGNEVIKRGGNFGGSESTAFCIKRPEDQLLCQNYNNIDFTKASLEQYGDGYRVKANFETGLSGLTTFGLSQIPKVTPTTIETVQYQESIIITFENKYTEDAIAEYIIEKRKNHTLDYFELGHVAQTGKNQYQISDPFPYNGLNEYRLVIVLKNGEKITHCESALVNYEPTEEFKLTPNPTSDLLTVIISDASIQDELSFSVFDILGRQVSGLELVSKSGVLRYDIDVSSLAAGQYYFVITNKSGYRLEKSFIKLASN